MARQLTKSTGAESGAESYLIAYVLVLAWMPFVGVRSEGGEMGQPSIWRSQSKGPCYTNSMQKAC